MQLFSLGLLVASALPVLKICLMCCVGVVLARRDILNQAGRQNLSLLVFLVFVPGLTFTKLGRAVSFDKLGVWWPLPVNVFLSLVFGSGLGWLCARLLNAPKWFRTHITLAVGCGNVGNIPLVLVATMCSDPHMPFHNSLAGQCNELGIAYVAFGMWVAMLFQFSLAFKLLKPAETPALNRTPSKALTDGGLSKENVALLHSPSPHSDAESALHSPLDGSLGQAPVFRAWSARRSTDAQSTKPQDAEEQQQLLQVVLSQPDCEAREDQASHRHQALSKQGIGVSPVRVVLQDRDRNIEHWSGAAAADRHIQRDDSAARFHHGSQSPMQDSKAGIAGSRPDSHVLLLHGDNGLANGGDFGNDSSRHAAIDTAAADYNSLSDSGCISSDRLAASTDDPAGSATDAELELQPLNGGVPVRDQPDASRSAPTSAFRRPAALQAQPSGSFNSRQPLSAPNSGALACICVLQRALRQCRETTWARKVYGLIEPVLNVPTMAAALGLIVGCVPALKALFFGDNAPLAILTDSAEIFGQAMIPAILLVLGAVLCKGPGQGKLPMRLVIGVVVVHLLVIPALGLGAVVGLWRLGVFAAPDKLFLLVMLITNSTPTAINLQTVATMHSNGEAEMSVLLFWQYLACIFTLPVVISVYLWAIM